MKIALIGYGKMGKAIEQQALLRGHEIVFKANSSFSATELSTADVAIEFTNPTSAVQNIEKCFDAKVPVVVGTTGWYDDFDTVKEKCLSSQNALMYATNFSLGVNLFFHLNDLLSKWMNNYKEYTPDIEEIHHTEKLDAPSGTAITLAEKIIDNLDHKKEWKNELASKKDELAIISKREPNVPGTHKVTYNSEIDSIEIKHTANSRKGFALGAVIAAEWLIGKHGVFTMNDLLDI